MKPPSDTFGPEHAALFAELCWSVMKWTYHVAEKVEPSDLPNSKFISFKSSEYQEKLNRIYEKYPQVKDKKKFFEWVLIGLCDAELIKCIKADPPRMVDIYAITEQGVQQTEPWYKGNGGAGIM
ncbi:MAG: hypothetical protein Q7R94_03245 [bacterium]|nr:hypothetical protein [bacterium]